MSYKWVIRVLLMFFAALEVGFIFGQSIWSNPITGTNPNTANPYTTGQTVDANITVSGIGRGSGITGVNTNDRYNAVNWNTTSIDDNAYFEFTLTPNSGYEIDFTSFVYSGQASGTGPTSFAFRSSIDSYASNFGSPSAGGTTISLSAAAYQNITSGITFRFYGWSASSGSGTFSINDFTFNGTVNALPIISVSPTTLSGFTYVSGNGPSSSQTYTISASDLTPTSGNITVSAPTDYDVSTSPSFSPLLSTLAYTGGSLSNTTIYVRLKSGRSVGTYNGQTISHSGGGATAQTVTLNGSVTVAPTISISPTSLSGFTYISGSGPSPAQQYTISAANLSPSSGNITVSTPTDYDVSTQTDFSTALTSLAYTSGTLNTTTVYVRLKAGLTVGTYNGQIINHSGGGATSQTVTLNGSSTLPIELLAFSGKVIEQSIGLFWSTATEKNNDYMAIERSFDGNNFSEIGRVKGAGSSLERIDYSFIDRFLYAGTNYYRLRQVDYDGTTTFHKVIAVEYTGVSENSLRFIPTAEEVQVQFRVPGAGGNMLLVDATGRVLRTQKFDPQMPSVQINTGGLPRGFYVVQVRRADGKREAWPLVK